MALFKKKIDSCPICDSGIERGRLMGHNLSHVKLAPDGKAGFAWVCKCGEEDGVWDQATGAAAALTQHMTRRHGLTFP